MEYTVRNWLPSVFNPLFSHEDIRKGVRLLKLHVMCVEEPSRVPLIRGQWYHHRSSYFVGTSPEGRKRRNEKSQGAGTRNPVKRLFTGRTFTFGNRVRDAKPILCIQGTPFTSINTSRLYSLLSLSIPFQVSLFIVSII